jgi:V/A-type H+-transporting ATPase subunit I
VSIARQLELTLIGDTDRKIDILDGLQALGAVHLVPLTDKRTELGPDTADDAREALTYLRGSPRKRRPQRAEVEPDIPGIVGDVLRNKYMRADVIDRIELIRQRRRVLRHWGAFELPPLEELDGNHFWFYLVPQGMEAGLEAIRPPWQIVSEDQRYHYLVVVSPEEPTGEDVPFQRVHTGSRSLRQLAEALEEELIELENLEAEWEAMTRWIVTLQESLNRILDSRDLQLAARQTVDGDGCFAVRGWIPETAEPRLWKWVDTVPAGYTLREPDEDDTPPTLLNNSDTLGGGEAAVSFFQLPGYTNWDPSALIFLSFSLFFAMILADVGYGLLLGVILAMYWRRISRSGRTGVRLRNMWASLVGCSVAYGAMVGSYFGVSPAESSLAGAISVLDLSDFDTMMRLSLGVGVLHLMIAHGMVFWINRGTRVGMVALGWLIGVGCAFGLWLQYMTADNFSLAGSPWLLGLVAWLVLLVLFSGKRPFDSARNIAFNLGAGLGALTGLTQAFGDVLSYMRLFALGLAGASLAATFNDLAVAARDGSPQFGFLFFFIIVVLGHTLNFVLCLMSGVIHGLRLNLMEFYNWGIQGEGYPFKAFAKRGDSKWKNL